MSSNDQVLLHRRDFLRAVVAISATVVLGGDATAEATNDARAGNLNTSLSYWSGVRFVNPAGIGPGDAFLCETGARITIQGHYVPHADAAPVLSVLKAHYAVQASAGTHHVPFYGWVATRSAGYRSVFHMPVQASHGLRFSVETCSARAAGEEIYHLGIDGHSALPQLRAGTYVLAAGTPDWTGCRLVSRHGRPTVERAGKPVDFEYLPIVVEYGS